MTTLMRYPLLAAALVLALPAMAGEGCEHSRSETPTLDLTGVSRVLVDIGADRLTATTGTPSLAVRHCASTESRLAASTFTIERRGTDLVLAPSSAWILFNWSANQSYLRREITLALPADLPIVLDVGSGDAQLSGFSNISVDLGSGDVGLREVGVVNADVGSGDLKLDGATQVSVDVGSGDAVLKRVQGEVSAEVGSGDVKMEDVGPLSRLTAGSGSIEAVGVRGDAQVTSVGSGDVQLQNVRGQVRVDSVGSGDVSLRDVDGDVVVADKDTLDNVDTRRIRGRILIGG